MTSVHDTVQVDSLSPLKGDGSGVYRVHIVGNSGGSTLADELGSILGVPVIHFDRLFWNPGWVKTPSPEFQARVTAALLSNECAYGWVVDGNYNKRLNGQLDDATDIIWLDPPFLLYFSRLLKRTFLRLFRRREPCAPGCDERISEALFSRKSILWWAITQHRPVQRKQAELFKVDGVHVGGKMRRIGGWGRELEEWKRAVSVMVKADNSGGDLITGSS
ncbi:hypothetical protein ACEPAI_3587 [Sanghuangporus weigelae]